ncbi:1,4-alpha-glucan branching enzyme GlgB OS=Streptomyces tendae OX=1932 GN=glgB PE=3 SV=1 [Streptomyces tendae]
MTPRPPSSGPDPKKTTGKKTAQAKKTAGKKTAQAKKTAGKKTAQAKKTPGKKAVEAEKAVEAQKTADTKKTVEAQKTAETKTTAEAEKTSAGQAAKTRKAPRKAAVPSPPAGSEAPAAAEVAVSPALGAGDRDRLLAGAHHDPHAVLGAHRVPGGVAFRVFRPHARAVTVLSTGLRVELHDDGDGFFSGSRAARRGPGPPPPGGVRGDGPGGRGPVPLPAHAGRAGPAPDRRGPARGAVAGAGRAPDDPGRAWTGTRFAVWAPNAPRGPGGRRLQLLGRHGVTRCARWARPACGSCSCRASARASWYKFEITRADGSRTGSAADPMARADGGPAGHRVRRAPSRTTTWGDGEWLARRADAPRTRRRCPCTRCTCRPGGRA